MSHNYLKFYMFYLSINYDYKTSINYLFLLYIIIFLIHVTSN